jgi:hypothetical protein
VSQRLPHDDEIEFSVWNHKRAPRFETSRRLIVAHAERSVGESIALILGLRGFTALYAKDLEMARMLLGSWDPQVLLIDTRLETSFGFAFTETFAADPAHAHRFLIAMTDIIFLSQLRLVMRKLRHRVERAFEVVTRDHSDSVPCCRSRTRQAPVSFLKSAVEGR